MIKKIITTTTLLAASVALANAATVVFTTNNESVTGATEKIQLSSTGNSGSAGSDSNTTNNTYTYTASTTKFDGSNALKLEYKVSSGKCWATAKSLNTNTNTTLTSAFSSASGLSLSDYAGKTFYGSGAGETTATLTFSGLKANTQYRVSFVSGARDESNSAGTLTLTTGSLFSTTEGGGSFYGSLSGSNTTSVSSFDSSNGISLTSVQYTTDTNSAANANEKTVPTVASTAISVVVTSSSEGKLVFNATSKPGFALIAISDSIPEPSAFSLLAGIGAIALAVSRRRRKH